MSTRTHTITFTVAIHPSINLTARAAALVCTLNAWLPELKKSGRVRECFNLRGLAELEQALLQTIEPSRVGDTLTIGTSGAVGQALGMLQSQAAVDVLTERARQVTDQAHLPVDDDGCVNDELAAMACYYAMPPGARDWPAAETGYGATWGEAIRPENWNFQSGDRRRELVKAAALALAEIERMDRAAAKGGA